MQHFLVLKRKTTTANNRKNMLVWMPNNVGACSYKMVNLLPDLDQGITALLESLGGPKHNVPEIQIQDK